jgi:hypothetical protein
MIGRVRAWITCHQNTLLYLFVTAVFVFTVAEVGALRASDAEKDRQHAQEVRMAAVRFCESGNERTVVLRDFILAAAGTDPDPRQYDYIADPTLRQGVIDQSRKSRADMRDRVSKTFTLRNCPADFPPPSDN